MGNKEKENKLEITNKGTINGSLINKNINL